MSEDTEIVHGWLVFLGKFNPAIFSPAWFAKNGLINDDELAAAETEAVHPQVTRFSIDHLTITCEPKRFQISLTTEPLIQMLDIALQLFRELLPHTPLHAFGVNYVEHWRVDSWERRMALGRALAPIEPWGAWGQQFDSSDPEKAGGLSGLSVRKPFADGIEGFQRAEIGPSKEITDKLRGVRLAVNHHREIEEDDAQGAKAIVDLLEKEFDSAIRQAKAIINDVKGFSQRLDTGQ